MTDQLAFCKVERHPALNRFRLVSLDERIKTPYTANVDDSDQDGWVTPVMMLRVLNVLIGNPVSIIDYRAAERALADIRR